MVSMEKIVVKGKCIILDPEVMHPHMTGSILQIMILLNQRDKMSKEIMLIVFIALPRLEGLI